MKTFDLSQENQKTDLKIILYGDSGSGKTTLAGTLFGHADFSPAVYVSLDRSGGVLENVPKDLTSLILETSDDVFRLLNELTTGSLKGTKYVIVDGLSAFMGTLLELETMRLFEESKASAKKTKSPHAEFPTETPWTAYGPVYSTMRQLVIGLSVLPMNVVCISWADEEYAKVKVNGKWERGEVPISVFPVLGSRKQRNSILGLFDMVWYMQATETHPAMLTVQKGPVWARTRDPIFRESLDKVIHNPNLVPLVEAYKAKKAESR